MPPERTGFPTAPSRRARLAPGMRRVGRAIAVLATLTATAGGATAHAAPLRPSARALGTTFTVNSAADDNDGACTAVKCTLRDAIAAANAATGAGTNTIAFSIAPAGPATITLLSSLPAITQAVEIDATTQPGVIDGLPPI